MVANQNDAPLCSRHWNEQVQWIRSRGLVHDDIREDRVLAFRSTHLKAHCLLTGSCQYHGVLADCRTNALDIVLKIIEVLVENCVFATRRLSSLRVKGIDNL